MSTYSQKWDLDLFYEGGSQSPAFKELLNTLKTNICKLKDKLESLLPSASVAEWNELLAGVQKVGSQLTQSYSFIGCLTAADVTDEKAKLLSSVVTQIGAEYNGVLTILESKLVQVSNEDWTKLVESTELKGVAFALTEKRKRALEKLTPKEEQLVGDLSVDGYHAWGEMYSTVVGRMQIPFEEDGETKLLSVGQMFNKFSTADRETRKKVFEKWEEAWAKDAELCALALNNLAGYRLQLYKHRKWDNVLQEPLNMNRMKQETLDMMWDTIVKNKQRLVPYFERKAQLLGIDRLSWYDVEAPLPGEDKVLSYDEAAAFITEQFEKFNPEMASFARMAFEKRWIEAEDRPGKRPGGFMTDFPENGESRIFMTFSGTPNSVSTLAHELGHSYHTYVMKDLPFFAQEYAMNVAETASTFAEIIVIDAAIKQASTKEEKIALLSEKIQSAVSFYMNIHARFLFETRFYQARKEGPLSIEELSNLMVEAQKEAYVDALDEYHPHFWAAKLHFYATDVPFYNFPYTFGYLFSTGIYAKALEEGAAFAKKYDHLLLDTASMTVEELAQKHLGVDLTKPDFWQNALDLIMKDVEEFITLTN